MLKRYELSDTEWNKVANLLTSENTGKRGRLGKDNWTMLNAMICLARSGTPWRDLPGMALGKRFTAAFVNELKMASLIIASAF